MKLTKESRPSADVFRVGEELPEDDVEHLTFPESGVPFERVSVDDLSEAAPFKKGPAVSERSAHPSRRTRWLGVVGVLLGTGTLAAIVFSGGGDESGVSAPGGNEPSSAQLIDQRATDGRGERSRELRSEQRREQRVTEARGNGVREEHRKGEEARGDAQDDALAPEPAPTATTPAPTTPAPSPVETAPAVTTAPAPPAPAPAPAPTPEPAADSGGGSGQNGGSCGPYDIGC